MLLTTASALGPTDLVDVAFPLWEKGRLIAEETAYRDLLGLRLAGRLCRGVVLARDLHRDLALIQMAELPVEVEALRLCADHAACPADIIHTVGHPLGVELLWLYGRGSVRQTARISLSEKAGEEKVDVALLQLPQQARACGGAVVNDLGDVVGLLIGKETTQQQIAYAVTAEGLRGFLKASDSLVYPRTPKEIQAKAEFLLKHGWPEEAARLGETLRAKTPQSQELLSLVVRALLASGKLPDALKRLEATRKVVASSAGLLSLCAEVYLELGDTKVAKAECDKALLLDPRHPLALGLRGRLRGEVDGIADLDEAVRLAPDDAAILAWRARLLADSGKIEQGLEDCRSRDSIRPLFPTTQPASDRTLTPA